MLFYLIYNVFTREIMKYIYWSDFNKQITAFTTTCEIGNVAFQVSNNNQQVIDNRKQIIKDLNIASKQLIFVHQSHSDRIIKVDKNDLGKGEFNFESGLDCDALYTTTPNLALGIFHADCVPVFFFAPKHNLIGIIHAGFKGTLKEITYKSISYIIKQEKINPQDLYFYLGPSLSYKYYHLNDEDKNKIIELGYQKAIIEDGVDVPLINCLQLHKLGVSNNQIKISNYDTGEDLNLFSAYRNYPIGRMASIIMLK